MRSAAAAYSLLVLLGVVACSSSSPRGGGTPDSGQAGAPPTCSCDVSYNGVGQTIACGGQACVNSVEFACSSTAQVTQGSACSGSTDSGAPAMDSGAPTPDSGSSGDDAASSGCSLFTCTNTAGCGGIAPCMSTAAGPNYCYEQEGSPAQCSAGTTPTTATTSNGPTTLCVPAGCPQPVMFVP